MSAKVLAKGPLTLGTASWPGRPDFESKWGNLPDDGRKAKIPQHAAGIRRDPPGVLS